MTDDPHHCPQCGTTAAPAVRSHGSLPLELAVYAACLLPGLIYTLYRLTTREPVCPTCRAPHMIPLDAPRIRAAQKE